MLHIKLLAVRKEIVGAVLLLLIPLASALTLEDAEPLPRFQDFSVSEIYRGKPAPAQPTSRFAHQFRTVIRRGAAKGPNFAGHYTVIIWGCGTSCAQFAIADALTGRIFDPPFDAITWGDEKGFLKESGFHFKLNSFLLLVQGCPEEKDCAARYYKWNGTHLALLRAGPVERFSVRRSEPPAVTVRP